MDKQYTCEQHQYMYWVPFTQLVDCGCGSAVGFGLDSLGSYPSMAKSTPRKAYILNTHDLLHGLWDFWLFSFVIEP
jgi:hypothetical protein